MLLIRLHAHSDQCFRWPETDLGILSQAKRILSQEQMLPVTQQFPRIDLLQEQIYKLENALATSRSAEATRTAASDEEKEALALCQRTVRRIMLSLQVQYTDHLAVLEYWGVQITEVGESLSLRSAYTRDPIIKMLNRYIDQENALPPEQRISTLSLVEVTSARDALVSAYRGRRNAIARRKAAVATRAKTRQAILQLLQLIAHYHTVIAYEGAVDVRLQSLGFDMMEIRRRKPRVVQDEE